MPMNSRISECVTPHMELINSPYTLPSGYRFVYIDEVVESDSFR